MLLKGKVKKSQKKKKPRNVSFAFTRIADICQYLQLPGVVYFFQAGVKIPSTQESTELNNNALKLIEMNGLIRAGGWFQ